MKTERVYLDVSHDVYLDTYVLDDYAEFQCGIKRRSVLVFPGGGYEALSDREGEPVAMKFLAKGYNAFVLHYSIGNLTKRNIFQKSIIDALKAIDYIKTNHESLSIDPKKIVLIGFSAGAHLCASAGNIASFSREINYQPANDLQVSAVVLCYPWISLHSMKNRLEETDANKDTVEYFNHANISFSGFVDPALNAPAFYDPIKTINPLTPPTFIWHTSNDDLVFVDNSLDYAKALTKNHIPYELHIYENGHHGLALCDKTTENRSVDYRPDLIQWQETMFTWLDSKIPY